MQGIGAQRTVAFVIVLGGAVLSVFNGYSRQGDYGSSYTNLRELAVIVVQWSTGHLYNVISIVWWQYHRFVSVMHSCISTTNLYQ